MKNRIPGKPEGSMETANLVTARYYFCLNGWGFPIRKVILGTLSLLAPLEPILFIMPFVI
jgi:hypothetical protein